MNLSPREIFEVFSECENAFIEFNILDDGSFHVRFMHLYMRIENMNHMIELRGIAAHQAVNGNQVLRRLVQRQVEYIKAERKLAI